VGCGNVGSRHLQGLVTLSNYYPIEINVIEPNPMAREIAINRIGLIQRNNLNLKLSWLGQLDNINEESDLTIVATLATGRIQLLDSLLKKGHRKFIIEKMVCQSVKEYDFLLELFEKHHAKGWVNCVCRSFEFYQKIKNKLPSSTSIILNVTSGNLGLGSNAIHYLDLFSYFIGKEGYNLKIIGNHLYPALLTNRRENKLVEFAGSIIAQAGANHYCLLTFSAEKKNSAVIFLQTDHIRFMVDEWSTKAYWAGETNQWKWEDTEFRYQHISELVTSYAVDIFETDECVLSSIEQSYITHKELFHVFNTHYQVITGIPIDLCPIT